MNEVKKLFIPDRVRPHKNKNDQCFEVESAFILPFFHEKTLQFLCKNCIDEVLTSSDKD